MENVYETLLAMTTFEMRSLTTQYKGWIASVKRVYDQWDKKVVRVEVTFAHDFILHDPFERHLIDVEGLHDRVLYTPLNAILNPAIIILPQSPVPFPGDLTKEEYDAWQSERAEVVLTFVRTKLFPQKEIS